MSIIDHHLMNKLVQPTVAQLVDNKTFDLKGCYFRVSLKALCCVLYQDTLASA